MRRVVSKVASDVSLMGLRPAEEDLRRTPALFTMLTAEQELSALVVSNSRHYVADGL